MQPIFDFKGDNSQRADVSGSLGKLAYQKPICVDCKN